MASPPIRILIPPSEGKAPGGEGPVRAEVGEGAFAGLARHRKTVIAASDRKVLKAATLSAMRRYTGVLYKALDYAALPSEASERADEQLVIFSGLWGLVAPTDHLPDYKLPIGTTLPKLGGLGTWWKPRLSPVLNAHVADAVVWDLLPSAHANAWADAGAAAKRWTVRVVRETSNGTRITVSHDNKATKGYLARHVLLHGVRDPRELEDLELPAGYRVDMRSVEQLTGPVGGIVEVVSRV